MGSSTISKHATTSHCLAVLPDIIVFRPLCPGPLLSIPYLCQFRNRLKSLPERPYLAFQNTLRPPFDHSTRILGPPPQSPSDSRVPFRFPQLICQFCSGLAHLPSRRIPQPTTPAPLYYSQASICILCAKLNCSLGCIPVQEGAKNAKKCCSARLSCLRARVYPRFSVGTKNKKIVRKYNETTHTHSWCLTTIHRYGLQAL